MVKQAPRIAPLLCSLLGLAAPAAANGSNACSSATELPGNGTYPFDNTAATTDAGVACGSIGSDLWWSWQAPCSTQVTVSTRGLTSLDTVLAVYAGEACPPSVLMGCNDDGPQTFQSLVTFNSTAGTTYLVRLGGFGGAQGTGSFSLSFECCPTAALSSTTAGPGGPPVASPAAVSRLLARLYLARDRVMRPTPTGRRWIERFYEHSPAMWRLLSEDEGLRRRASALVAAIGPGLDALAADEPPARPVRIPPHAVALLASVLDDLERAEPDGALARDLRAERELLGLERLAGRTYAEVWERINERALAREPAQEPLDATTPSLPGGAKRAPATAR